MRKEFQKANWILSVCIRLDESGRYLDQSPEKTGLDCWCWSKYENPPSIPSEAGGEIIPADRAGWRIVV